MEADEAPRTYQRGVGIVLGSGLTSVSDASVPFNFDVHALFFSNDAVGIETQIHARLADRCVNLVSQRREFFHLTPAEAKTHLLALAGNLLQYEEVPEALEYRQSTADAN
ncbi:GIY-YIG nuclease family protein [Micromonospora purpureochromogenes]|uniref:GIY-YIG nuclease family protein n=1 Tax=Micromonospora purpureochromogenes TaxID=47872 RepID=UPI0033D8C335